MPSTTIERKFLKKSNRSDYARPEIEVIAEKASSTIQTLEQRVDIAVEKVDEKIQELGTTLTAVTGQVEQAISELKNLEAPQGEKGEPGDSPDIEEIVSDVLSRIPQQKVDEAALVSKVLKAIPKTPSSLKIVQESIDQDKLIDDIVPKLKLKIENIDGLDKSLKALDRRYIHGGGDTVAAGANITITTNNRGDKVINAAAGGTTTTTVTSSTYLVTATTGTDNIFCDATAQSITVTLPTANNNTATINVKKVDSTVNTVTINCIGAETIDEDLTQVIQFQNTSLQMVSDDSNWRII